MEVYGEKHREREKADCLPVNLQGMIPEEGVTFKRALMPSTEGPCVGESILFASGPEGGRAHCSTYHSVG